MKNLFKRKKMEKPTWKIHAIHNGLVCAHCGEVINDMITGFSNYHTHGMSQYNHPDFQLVLDVQPEDAAFVLNTFGECVRAGERFEDGSYIKGLFPMDIYLASFENEGREMLRVILPDNFDGNFPWDENCHPRFKHQLLETNALYANHATSCSCFSQP